APVCARAEPGRAGLGAAQAVPGQPGQTQPRPAHRAGQDPAAADAIPAQPARPLARLDRAGSRTLRSPPPLQIVSRVRAATPILPPSPFTSFTKFAALY